MIGPLISLGVSKNSKIGAFFPFEKGFPSGLHQWLCDSRSKKLKHSNLNFSNNRIHSPKIPTNSRFNNITIHIQTPLSRVRPPLSATVRPPSHLKHHSNFRTTSLFQAASTPPPLRQLGPASSRQHLPRVALCTQHTHTHIARAAVAAAHGMRVCFGLCSWWQVL
jgi:hypothetical protein